jgi:putative flippase GtrA
MKFPRYIIIGGVCALISNILIIGFARSGFNYFLATCLAFGPVLLVGYALHTSFTFETSASWLSFGRYTLSMLVNYPVWFASLYLFCNLFGVSVTIAAPATTIILFIWNYLSAGWALLALGPKSQGSV